MQNQLSKDEHIKDYAKSLIHQFFEISCPWNYDFPFHLFLYPMYMYHSYLIHATINDIFCFHCFVSKASTLDYKILLQISFFFVNIVLFLAKEYKTIKEIMAPIQRKRFRSVKYVQSFNDFFDKFSTTLAIHKHWRCFQS